MFLATLAEAIGRLGWLIHADVLMSTHYHFVLETPEPNLVGEWIDCKAPIPRASARHRIPAARMAEVLGCAVRIRQSCVAQTILHPKNGRRLVPAMSSSVLKPCEKHREGRISQAALQKNGSTGLLCENLLNLRIKVSLIRRWTQIAGSMVERQRPLPERK